MPQVSRRLQRFEKEVRQLTSEFLIYGINDPIDGMVSVSRVHVSPDLRTAKVYLHFTAVKNEDETMEVLKFYAPPLQKYIHSKLRSKFCPRVIFILDKSYEKILRVEKLLHEISEEQ